MCKYCETYDDVIGEICLLTGKSCFVECDCGFEPDEYDVMNGYFDDDPEGLERWQKEQKGISCKTCKHNTKRNNYNSWCTNCIAYELYDSIEKKEDLTHATQ